MTIIDHVKQNITEVVLYEPSLGEEFQRIYLDTAVLISKLCLNEIEKHLVG